MKIHSYRERDIDRTRTVISVGGAVVERALREMHEQTQRAALAFEGRWTMLALRRINADIEQRLREQRSRFAQACITGGAVEIREEGEALCRGYRVAAQALEDAGEADDAYLIGRCPLTGLTVVIGEHPAAAMRARELYGEDVLWFSPDEIASVLVSPTAMQSLLAVKRKFPGAEMIDKR